MARQVTVKVEGHRAVREGELYPGIVCNIEKKSKRLQVTLRNLDPDQDGREHELSLRLPVRPSGRTAAFFKAVGQEVEVGKTLALRDAIGKVVRMKFGPSPEGGMGIVSFEPLVKETKNGAEPE